MSDRWETKPTLAFFLHLDSLLDREFVCEVWLDSICWTWRCLRKSVLGIRGDGGDGRRERGWEEAGS